MKSIREDSLFHPSDPQKKPTELRTLPKAFLPPILSKITAYTQESQKLENPAGTLACEEAKQGRCSGGSGVR